ncbi:MAG: CPBP family intramembrane metalloprotease [Hyphomicrobiaceae bacterium]|nr:CPBP family intramembrane metalloprotease [Hyphomicrobiaceae bacterium]
MQTNRSTFAPLALYFAVAFGWAWAFWVPEALREMGMIEIPEALTAIHAGGQPAAWGPLIAAIIVALVYQRGPGLRELLSSIIRVRFSPWYYLVAVALLPAIVGMAQLVAIIAGETVPPSPAFAEPISIPISFIFIFFLSGPLQEEAGWRGTATRLIQTRTGALWASLVTGVAWGLWHLPLFFMQREDIYYNRPFLGLLISTMLLSVLFTWVYNNTRKSLFAAMLIHTSWNWSNYLFTGLLTDAGGLTFMLLLTAVVIVVVVRFGPQRLTRSDSQGW